MLTKLNNDFLEQCKKLMSPLGAYFSYLTLLSSLETFSVDELRKLLSDKDAYNRFLYSLDQVNVQNSVSVPSFMPPKLYNFPVNTLESSYCDGNHWNQKMERTYCEYHFADEDFISMKCFLIVVSLYYDCMMYQLRDELRKETLQLTSEYCFVFHIHLCVALLP
ncbi:hypothetical protein QQ045_022610 [Rhodiola kirilowii]